MLTTIIQTSGNNVVRDNNITIVRVISHGQSSFLATFLGHDKNGQIMVKKNNGHVAHLSKGKTVTVVDEIVENTSSGTRSFLLGKTIR